MIIFTYIYINLKIIFKSQHIIMSSEQSQSSSVSSGSSSRSPKKLAKNKKYQPKRRPNRKRSSSEDSGRYKKKQKPIIPPLPQPKKSKFTLEPQIPITSAVKPVEIAGSVPIQRIPQHMQKNYKFAMKVYVCNLPENFNKDDLANFLYKSLEKANGLLEPGNPIINSTYYADKKYIFYTFRSIQETTQCFQLDGIIYRGKSLKFKRPTDYQQNTKDKKIEGNRILPKMDLSQLKIYKISNVVENGFNRLFVGNFPLEFQEENFLEILSKYGELKSFCLTTDKQTNASKGFGFCEYHTDMETQECLKKLNKAKILNKQIWVKRAILMNAHQLNTGILNNSSQFLSTYDQQITYNPQLINPLEQKPVVVQTKSTAIFQKDLESYYATFDINGFFKNLKISCVLLLKNIIPLSVDPEVIKKDVLSQMERIGKVIKIVYKLQSIWIQYEKVEYSQIAYLLLLNNKYDGKSIDVSFYDPILFADTNY